MNDLPDSWYPTHWRCQLHEETGSLDDDSLDEHAKAGHDGVIPTVMVYRESA